MKHKKKQMKTCLLGFAAVLSLVFVLGILATSESFAGENVGTQYIVKYKEGAAETSLRLFYLESEPENSGLPFDVVSEEEVQRLRDAGLLEWYEPDGLMTLLDGESSLYYADDKWDLTMINAEPAFRAGAIGDGVKVAVIDSGVNALSYFADSLLPGRNYTYESSDESDTSDSYGHGTLVAALISGYGREGYIGAAPGAKIVPLKVTDGKTVAVSTVCEAMYGAINDYDCKVLNLSLGINSDFQVLREVVDYAEKKGVVIVSAAGNNGNTVKMYPAAYESVIGVGAVGRDGSRFYHSNHNDSVFITAPGANVKTAGKSGGYVTNSGTSFSVPFVTAAAAVLFGIDPFLEPADIQEILAKTAQDRGDEGWDEYYGYGILDLGACVKQLGGAGRLAEYETPCGIISTYTLANFTDEDIECAYLLAEYDEKGRFTGVSKKSFMLPARGRARIEPPEGDIYGQFLCAANGLAPLAEARKST